MAVTNHKLYFALQPPAETAQQALRVLRSLRPAEGFTAQALPAERLHVSLNWVGGFQRPPAPVIGKACEVAASVSARPFDVAFNRVGTWTSGDSPWPLVLWGDEGVIGAEGLHTAIHRAMVRTGMAPRREPQIVPHLTLLRDRAVMPEAFIDPIRWTVREFVLIHSLHGKGRHDVVGRFPLTG